LIFAAGTFSNPASSFGHVFLKLINRQNAERDLLNYGVNYSARSGDVTGALYMWYGLLGFFPGNYGMAPYHHLIKEYTNLEGRDLWEYELNLSSSEIERLIKHLRELEKGFIPYYFIDDNCARMIALALEVARPELEVHRGLELWVLPLDTVRSADQQGLIVARHFRPSLQTEFNTGYEALTFAEKWQLRELVKTELPHVLPQMSVRELEAAQDYYALLGAHDFQQYAKLNYELAKERSRRSENSLPLRRETPDPPEGGPDSAKVWLGVSRSSQTGALVMGARAVGNDLLDSDVGTAKFSVLEVLAFELTSTTSRQTQLADFTLLNVLSTHPVTWVQAPLSWGLKIDWDQGWQVPLKVGYTFEQKFARLMIFLTGEMQEDVSQRRFFTPGAEALLAFHFTTHWRGWIADDQDISGRHNQVSGGVAFDLTRAWQVRYERQDVDRVSLGFSF
jgi:hypothetical protein